LPRKALTAASVQRIKPPASGQVEHFDKGYPGLALRVSYGGGKSWIFFYRTGGRLRRMTLGTYPALSLAEAREAWRNARTEAQAGRDPATARKRKVGLSDFRSVSEEWLQRDQSKNRTHREAERVVKRELLPAWEHRLVGDIGRRDILDLVDGIADRGSVIMARRVQGYIHRFFKWAVGRGIVESNPAADLPKPGAEVRRDRVLTDHELALAWRAAANTEWPFGPIYRLLILTGARREEIGGLHWSELADDEIRIAGERTKNGIPHVIPLSVPAKAVLQDVPRIAGSASVFGENRTPGGWDRAKKRLDAAVTQLNGEVLPHWRLHDFRRTVATGLQRLGVNLQTIEAVLGHTSGSRSGVVGVYQRHSFDAEKRVALEAWGAHVMGLVEGRRPGKVLAMRGRN
jgi:integrase